jgi:vacuolar-type H+-ATPase subunit E/Vma4
MTANFDPLDAVRDALRRAALDDVADMLQEASSRAQIIRRDSAARAAQIHDSAVAAGAADAAASVAARQAEAHRRGRGLVLGERLSALTRLRQNVRDRVRALASPEVDAVLAGAARRVLGADVAISAAAGGGIVAVAGPRRIDLSLDGFAVRAADAVAALEEP